MSIWILESSGTTGVATVEAELKWHQGGKNHISWLLTYILHINLVPSNYLLDTNVNGRFQFRIRLFLVSYTDWCQIRNRQSPKPVPSLVFGVCNSLLRSRFQLEQRDVILDFDLDAWCHFRIKWIHRPADCTHWCQIRKRCQIRTATKTKRNPWPCRFAIWFQI